MIYLDNAATTFPKPESVIRSMTYAQRNLGANPGRGGHKMSLKAGEIVYKTRAALSGMFSCESDFAVFTDNCTTALNTAIRGILEKGDHVIISSLEHNSVLRPVHTLSEEGKISYDVALVDPQNDNITLRNFHSLIKPNTKAIICTFCSNVFGTVLPIEKIGRLCRTRDIIFIVDGAQAVGCFEIDMKKMNIDILCMPGHKGLLGPMGTGVMLLSGKVIPDSLTQGGTGSYSLQKNQPDVLPDKFESGTVNFPGISGLLSGINYIKRIGGERAVHRKEAYLTSILREDLSVIKNIITYDDMRSTVNSPIVAFNVEGYHSEEIANALDRNNIAVRAGYHCSYLAHKTYGTEKNGVVRVSPGIFNSKKDVKNLVFYLNKIAMKQKM